MSWTFKMALLGLGASALCWAPRPTLAREREARAETLVLRPGGPEGPGGFTPLGGTAVKAVPDNRGVRPELRLSADHLSYQPTASRIDLGGRVVIELGQLQLRAPRLQIVLGAQGRPERLTATGGVTFSAGETSGRADQVLLLTQQRMALLQGKASVRLQRVGLDLHGEAVQLDLASGKLSVRSASASLRSRQSDGP